MYTQFYRLRAITNMHVGSGESNYGVIDKLIERDAASGLPCINSSGLKGAIKQKFKGIPGLKEVFGSDHTRNDGVSSSDSGGEDKNAQQGSCNFLPAHLLAIPLRTDKVPFILGVSISTVNAYYQFRKDLGLTENPITISAEHKFKVSDEITDVDLGQSGKRTIGNLEKNIETQIKTLLGTKHPVVVLDNETLIELCNDLNLTVIARNALEDGQSQNLWYEQVLPRESILYFPVMWDDASKKKTFDLTKGTLQVGGNASVGYGFTKITEIP
ncbi:MAG: type III-B CRISPR module RAMP protein Cmr4 [Saprospiraceae bacterium]|nr:type III-B CRISPR module RAMP protein Cmr4 [Saprospiraceae bacterium]